MNHKFTFDCKMRCLIDIDADSEEAAIEAAYDLLVASQHNQYFLDGFNEVGAGRRAVKVTRFELCWDQPEPEEES